jgi:hypothetical protein
VVENTFDLQRTQPHRLGKRGDSSRFPAARELPGDKVSDPGPVTGVGWSRRDHQLRRSPADLVLRLRAAQTALIRLPASGAEGQTVWVGPSPQVPGGRSVSFLVSFMYVYLRPLPSTTEP